MVSLRVSQIKNVVLRKRKRHIQRRGVRQKKKKIRLIERERG